MRHKMDWQAHIDNWKKSGLSKAEYCRGTKINQYNFYSKFRVPEAARTNRRNSVRNDKQKVTEIPLPGFFSAQPVSHSSFEFHLEFPFLFRFRINLNLGRRKT